MKQLIKLKRINDKGGWGYERVDVVAFNVDGSGTALVRVHPSEGPPLLELHQWNDDMHLLLAGDADGVYEYAEDGVVDGA